MRGPLNVKQSLQNFILTPYYVIGISTDDKTPCAKSYINVIVMPVPRIVMPIPRIVMPIPRTVMPIPRTVMPIPRIVMPVLRIVMPIPRIVMPIPRIVMPIPRISTNTVKCNIPWARLHFT
jgi:hypothetical protein